MRTPPSNHHSSIRQHLVPIPALTTQKESQSYHMIRTETNLIYPLQENPSLKNTDTPGTINHKPSTNPPQTYPILEYHTPNHHCPPPPKKNNPNHTSSLTKSL